MQLISVVLLAVQIHTVVGKLYLLPTIWNCRKFLLAIGRFHVSEEHMLKSFSLQKFIWRHHFWLITKKFLWLNYYFVFSMYLLHKTYRYHLPTHTLFQHTFHFSWNILFLSQTKMFAVFCAVDETAANQCVFRLSRPLHLHRNYFQNDLQI